MAFFSKKLGIDLGTANVLVYVPEKGIVVNEPSVVAISEYDHSILAIGNDARAMLGKTPDSIVAYRPMRDGVIADYRVTEAMLRYFMDKALGGLGWIKPEVMISVPAGVTSTERRAVVEAALQAGAKSAVIVKEPILAALGAGIAINEARGHMIIDIGGGTTDVAVISLGGIVSSTSIKCAGNKIDFAITDYLRKNYNLYIGEQTAEEIKKGLASAVMVLPDVSKEIKGRDLITGLPKTINITTNELVKAIDYELKQIIKAIKEVLQQTPPELASDIIDHGIVMTGGTSSLSNLDKLISEQTGVSVRVAENPLYCVVNGTGILLKHLENYQRSILSKK